MKRSIAYLLLFFHFMAIGTIGVAQSAATNGAEEAALTKVALNNVELYILDVSNYLRIRDNLQLYLKTHPLDSETLQSLELEIFRRTVLPDRLCEGYKISKKAIIVDPACVAFAALKLKNREQDLALVAINYNVLTLNGNAGFKVNFISMAKIHDGFSFSDAINSTENDRIAIMTTVSDMTGDFYRLPDQNESLPPILKAVGQGVKIFGDQIKQQDQEFAIIRYSANIVDEKNSYLLFFTNSLGCFYTDGDKLTSIVGNTALLDESISPVLYGFNTLGRSEDGYHPEDIKQKAGVPCAAVKTAPYRDWIEAKLAQNDSPDYDMADWYTMMTPAGIKLLSTLAVPNDAPQ